MKPAVDREHRPDSSIGRFLRCPLRYDLGRILRPPRRPATVARALGPPVHAAPALDHRRPRARGGRLDRPRPGGLPRSLGRAIRRRRGHLRRRQAAGRKPGRAGVPGRGRPEGIGPARHHRRRAARARSDRHPEGGVPGTAPPRRPRPDRPRRRRGIESPRDHDRRPALPGVGHRHVPRAFLTMPRPSTNRRARGPWSNTSSWSRRKSRRSSGSSLSGTQRTSVGGVTSSGPSPGPSRRGASSRSGPR